MRFSKGNFEARESIGHNAKCIHSELHSNISCHLLGMKILARRFGNVEIPKECWIFDVKSRTHCHWVRQNQKKGTHTHTHTLNVYLKWTGCKLAIKSKVRRGKTKHVNDFHEYNSSYFGTLIFGLIYHTSWERILYRASKSCTPKNKTPRPPK